MEWSQFLLMIGAFVGLFTWSRTENRSDYKHTQSMLESNRNLMDANRKEINQMFNAIIQENKDFHGRLCALEEKYINWKMEQK